MDRKMIRYIVSQVFGWAVIALHTDMPEVFPKEDALLLGEKVLRGERIPGEYRVLQDRFARVFQDLRGIPGLSTPETYEWLRGEVFSSWKGWGAERESNG